MVNSVNTLQGYSNAAFPCRATLRALCVLCALFSVVSVLILLQFCPCALTSAPAPAPASPPPPAFSGNTGGRTRRTGTGSPKTRGAESTPSALSSSIGESFATRIPGTPASACGSRSSFSLSFSSGLASSTESPTYHPTRPPLRSARSSRAQSHPVPASSPSHLLNFQPSNLPISFNLPPAGPAGTADAGTDTPGTGTASPRSPAAESTR